MIDGEQLIMNTPEQKPFVCVLGIRKELGGGGACDLEPLSDAAETCISHLVSWRPWLFEEGSQERKEREC